MNLIYFFEQNKFKKKLITMIYNKGTTYKFHILNIRMNILYNDSEVYGCESPQCSSELHLLNQVCSPRNEGFLNDESFKIDLEFDESVFILI